MTKVNRTPGARIMFVLILLTVPWGRQFAIAQDEEPSPIPSVQYVAQGSEPKAFAYYEQILTELGLNPNNLSGQALVTAHEMSDVLEYLGFGALRPEDLEKLPSSTLEDYDKLRVAVSNAQEFQASLDNAGINNTLNFGEIASARYFSPKITDVADSDRNPLNRNSINFGWRKLVRLTPLPGSQAKNRGVRYAYFLFNIFQENVPRNESPFGVNESVNSQLILERELGHPPGGGQQLSHPIYFLVYGRISAGAELITFLTASFDARNPNINPTGKYFVPHACAECHGGLSAGDPIFSKMKLNFIDTDHILDRLLFPDDFSGLRSTPHGALFDVGKLPGQDSRVDRKQIRAFDSIRAINGNITFQNKRVDGADADSFQTLAAQRWDDIHSWTGDPQFSNQVFTRIERAGLFDRALATEGSQNVWSAADPVDFELLPLLNRYCYRCHSSLRFSVFDKSAVVQRSAAIRTFMNLPSESNFHMPQDRVLPARVRGRMIELVEKLSPTDVPPE